MIYCVVFLCKNQAINKTKNIKMFQPSIRYNPHDRQKGNCLTHKVNVDVLEGLHHGCQNNSICTSSLWPLSSCLDAYTACIHRMY